MEYQKSLRQLERDQSASFWLKRAVLDLDGRDVIDALGDAQILLEYAKAKARECGIAA